jgi:chemotaxis signal transduction protein
MHTSETIKTENIEVLTFRINQTRFGVDLDEIYELIELDQANQRECNTTRFEEEFRFGDLKIDYISPKVLLPKGSVSSGILIDQVEEICHVSIDCIKPLPNLVKLFCQPRIWGTTLIDQQIVLLIELQ